MPRGPIIMLSVCDLFAVVFAMLIFSGWMGCLRFRVDFRYR